jgi:hypothetical protein
MIATGSIKKMNLSGDPEFADYILTLQADLRGRFFQLFISSKEALKVVVLSLLGKSMLSNIAMQIDLFKTYILCK